MSQAKNFEVVVTCPIYHKRYELENGQTLCCPACGGIHGKDDLDIVYAGRNSNTEPGGGRTVYHDASV